MGNDHPHVELFTRFQQHVRNARGRPDQRSGRDGCFRLVQKVPSQSAHAQQNHQFLMASRDVSQRTAVTTPSQDGVWWGVGGIVRR